MDPREIVTLAEARARGLVRYFTGKPCKRAHIDWRQTTSATCMACDREKYHARAGERVPQMREYQAANRDIVRRASKVWKADNSDRCRFHTFNRKRRLRGRGTVTAAQIADIHARQKYRCAACRVDTRTSFHPDHIQPVAKGGLNVIANIQILCPSCNYSKHAKDPIAWARERGLLL